MCVLIVSLDSDGVNIYQRRNKTKTLLIYTKAYNCVENQSKTFKIQIPKRSVFKL